MKRIITGEDVGAYGQDKKSNIIDLLKNIVNINGEYEIVICDFNPYWMIKYFNDMLYLFKNYPNKINEIQIPIQSASSKILKLMQRKYKIEDVDRCISILEKEVPDLKIHTHIIVGFPGESKNDFRASYNFIKKHRFHTVLSFCYQDRKMINSYKLNS